MSPALPSSRRWYDATPVLEAKARATIADVDGSRASTSRIACRQGWTVRGTSSRA